MPTSRNEQDSSENQALRAGLDQSQAGAAPILVRGLGFSYAQVPVLVNIDFELRRGISLGLIGPNGGGKTTFLKIILGELVPTSGLVRVFGRPPTSLGRLRAKIGYVPQKPDFDLSFPASALDVVVMGSYFGTGLFRRVEKGKRRRALELMDRFGISSMAMEQIGQLSSGQQQRAFIARALMSSPQLLILDEPTTGVDTEGQTRFYTQITQLKHDLGITILMVSHDVAQIADYVDEIACLCRTMHWHDRSELINEEVLHEVYACELDAYLKEHLRHIEKFHRRKGAES